MYFDTNGFISGCKNWTAILKSPILGELILGIQGDHNGKADPVFTILKAAWSWEIDSAFVLFFKPIVLLIVLAFNLILMAIKIAFMVCILPLWIMVVLLWNIKFGLPNYEPSWMSPYD